MAELFVIVIKWCFFSSFWFRAGGTEGMEAPDTISKGTCHVKTCWKAPRGDAETRLPDVRLNADTATDSVNINAMNFLKTLI